MIEISTSNFEKNTAKKLVVVKFYAVWCSPCTLISPLFEQLEGEFSELGVYFAKCNIDDIDKEAGRNLAPGKFEIMGIPAIIFYNDGKEVNRLVGSCTKEEIKKFIFDCIRIKNIVNVAGVY